MGSEMCIRDSHIGMNLVFITDAREQGVAEDAIHDIQERVEHQSCPAIGECLLNHERGKSVLAGRISIGMKANTHWRVESIIRNLEEIHELLLGSRQLTAVGHPGHPPFLIGVKVD